MGDHVARMKAMRNATFFVGVKWNNIKMDLKNIFEGCGLDSSGLGYVPVAISCDHSNEPSDSIQDEKFLECLSYY